MIFNSEGQQLFLSKFLKPHTWSFLKEELFESAEYQTRSGNFIISSAISRPRHIFCFAINSNKFENQAFNPFFFDTYNLPNKCKFQNMQLQLGSANFYPQEALNPALEIARAYRMLMGFNKGYNDTYTGSAISLEMFEKLYGIIYFDLRNQESTLKSGTSKISLKWSLNGTPNFNFKIYAVVLREETIEVVVSSGKAVIKV